METNYQRKIKKVDLIIGTISSILFLLFFINIDKFVYGGIPGSISPILLPKMLIILLIVLSIIMVGISISKKYNTKDDINHNTKIFNAEDNVVSQKFVSIYISILIVYLLLLYLFGYLISTPFIMFSIMFILGGRNLKVMLPLVIICPPIFYYLCYKLLKVMLPQGILFM